ncbi:MAG: prefoldin subunit alpha [Candidatus Bathyarchaeota archaeon]|nr:prefoldin subunit alpha [Candidatus Bathyarchaeota archaeon]
MRRLIVELQMMQGSAETLQQRLEVLQSAIADLSVAKKSLGAIKEHETGDPILVPTGGGVYVNANLGDLRKVIVNIGAEVAIEMDLGEAEEDISGRLEDVEKASLSVQQQLQQILAQMQIHQDVINRMGAELRGESPGV